MMDDHGISQDLPQPTQSVQQPPQPEQQPPQPEQQPVPPQQYYYPPVQYPRYVPVQAPAPKKKMSAGAVCGIIALCLVGAVVLAAVVYVTLGLGLGLLRGRQVEVEHEGPVNDNMIPSFQIVDPTGGEIIVPDPSIPDVTLPPVTPSTEIWYVTAKSGLLLRSGPGTEFTYIRALPLGTQVTVVRWDGNWAFTGEGWLSGKYLSQEPVPLKSHDPADFLSFQAPKDRSLVGDWLVVSDLGDSGMGRSCRAGMIRLKKDGTFEQLVLTMFNEYPYDSGWYCPGAETSGEDTPSWVGDYTFDGKTLVLHYRAIFYMEYGEDEYGAPIPLDDYWIQEEATVTLKISKKKNGDLDIISGADDIPIYSGPKSGHGTDTTLYESDDDDDMWSAISHTLNEAYP